MLEIPVVVIGAGQAGLCTSHCLSERQIPHVVLERGTVGCSWRRGRWDSFRLVTQNWQCRLPGEEEPLDPEGFMTHREVAQRLEQLARQVQAPVRPGSGVEQVTAEAPGRYLVETEAGSLWTPAVVAATGTYHRPVLPPMADRLDQGIRQLHSSAYRNPGALPAGAVLVVGSGQSGWQIARELHQAGRQVHWSLGRASRLPRRYRGRDIFRWLAELGVLDLPVDEHPGGELVREEPKPFIGEEQDGHIEDPRLLAQQGMILHGRLIEARGLELEFRSDMRVRVAEADEACLGVATFIDTFIETRQRQAPGRQQLVTPFEPPEPDLELNLHAAGISTIIWATGHRSNHQSWLDVDVFDDRGRPLQRRGVTPARGLYFVGLDWMHTWGSGLLYGVAADAAHVVDHWMSL